ncbi:MAG: indolepyruvate ferredoxin oxidoreductase, partial [Glaciecola sp.]
TVTGGGLRKPRRVETAQMVFDPLPEPQLPDLSERPWNTVVTGVGGTGVLTITSLVAMAAHLEGKGCATMNQTGLAQKFGAVVSHVRVAKVQDDIMAVRIPAGEADLLLGCDLVVTTTYEAMAKAAHGRTHAVVNDAEVPTASFILNPDARFPTSTMKQRVLEEVGDSDCHFLDSSRIATTLMGDSIASNLFLLGYAWQRGLVPVSAAALERAIELNAVAVDFNKQAFLYGRRYANRPDQVLALLPESVAIAQLGTAELIEDRAARLVDYQDTRYAKRYRDTIAAVQAADPRPEDSASLTATAAKSLYKLMAYKDEYEVARLYSAPEFLAKIEAKFEGDYSLSFNLAPPLWSKRDPHSGELQKTEFGPWMLTAFRVLAPLRRLRGTALDLFGYTAERRGERQDIADYEGLLGALCERMEVATTLTEYALMQELLALPQQLRGFGHVKDRNRDQLALRHSTLMGRLEGQEDIVQIVEAA